MRKQGIIVNTLKLKVNEEKSVACEVDKTVLLGHTILKSGDLVIAKENVERFKNSIRTITKRPIGVSMLLKKQGVVNYQSWIIVLSGVGGGVCLQLHKYIKLWVTPGLENITCLICH